MTYLDRREDIPSPHKPRLEVEQDEIAQVRQVRFLERRNVDGARTARIRCRKVQSHLSNDLHALDTIRNVIHVENVDRLMRLEARHGANQAPEDVEVLVEFLVLGNVELDDGVGVGTIVNAGLRPGCRRRGSSLL